MIYLSLKALEKEKKSNFDKIILISTPLTFTKLSYLKRLKLFITRIASIYLLPKKIYANIVARIIFKSIKNKKLRDDFKQQIMQCQFSTYRRIAIDLIKYNQLKVVNELKNTIFIYGNKDKVIYTSNQLKYLKNDNYKMLEGGHAINIEQEKKLNKLIIDHFRK
jgi:hypothetical protein